ncbi:MAG: efflux RND transporter periplasmic adaptor subunit [Planctomycetota bacterium]|nr:efflux RND transporter periplasmic adaptor subunit [Planctomycetota bacterium]
MRKNGVSLLAALAALVLLSGCPDKPKADTPAKKDEKAQSRRFLVRTAPVQVRPLQYEIETTGSLQADDIYRIDAQVAGAVEGVNFKEGDKVTPQMVLCRVATRTYELAAQRAKAAWQKAKDAALNAQANLTDTERKTRNDIARAKVKLSQAQRDVERVKPAFASGAVSQDELLIVQDKAELAAIELRDMEEAAKTLVDVMCTAAQQKDAEAKQAEVEWLQAEDDLRKSAVVSPVAGTIDQRYIANGTQVAPLTPTPVAQVIGTGLKLKFTLPEMESAHVREQTRVVFRVLAYPNRDFNASIYYISTLADPKARLVTCWATVDKAADAVLKSGFFTTVKIVTETRGSAIVVPLTAVQPTEQGFVAFVVADGKARRRPVELGLQVADQGIEVLKGLSPGEILVVEGGSALQDGVLVREGEAAATGEARPEKAPEERK